MSTASVQIFHSRNSAGNNWTLLGSHCRHLISTLNKKTYRSNVAEIAQLETLYEADVVELFVLKCLITQIDWKDTKRQKDQCRLQLLTQRIAQFSSQPNFVSVITQTIEEIPILVEGFFTNFSKTLKLTPVQEFTLAFGMAQSLSPNVKQQGLQFLKQKIVSISTGTGAGNEKIPDRVIHNLLFFLHESPEEDFEELDREKIIESFRKQYGSLITFMPMVNSQPTRNDVKRNWKKEAKMRASPFLKDLEKSFSPAELINDLGYACMSSPDAIKKVLTQFSLPLSASEVAEVIGMMAGVRSNTAMVIVDEPNAPTTWNIAVFASALRELCPDLKWDSVIEHLDYPDFWIQDASNFTVILEVYKKATGETFPVEILFRKWKNTAGLLSFLKAAVIAAPKEDFQFPMDPTLVSFAQEQSISPDNSEVLSFCSLPLLTTFLRISTEGVGFYLELHQMCQKVLQTCPNLLLVALSLTKLPCTLKNEHMNSLFPPVLLTNSLDSILSIVWKADRSFCMDQIKTLFTGSEAHMSRLLEVSMFLEDLPAILDIFALDPMSINLAFLASHHGHLALAPWLEQMITKHGDPFFLGTISYLKERLARKVPPEQAQNQTPPPEPAQPPLAFDVIQFFLDVLKKFSAQMSAETQEQLNQLISIVELEVFPSDIEKEANVIFSRIYEGEINIEQIIQLLQTFKESTNQRELKIFECMIQSLYEEYPHIPKYPDKELQITGVLFGSLIQHQLVSYIPLVIALRYILEALKQPVGSKLFKFGIFALEQFTSRLPEWPQYCSHLRQISHLQTYHFPLYQHIEGILRAQQQAPQAPTPGGFNNPGQIDHGSDESFQNESQNDYSAHPVYQIPEPQSHVPQVEQPRPTNLAGSIFDDPENDDPLFDELESPSATPDPVPPPPRREDPIPTVNLGAVLGSTFRVIEPNEKVTDIIHFVFNNVSTSTMDTKVREIKSVLSLEMFDYLAFYVVVKRVIHDDNFHELYCNFIHRFQLKELNRKLLRFTVAAIKILLNRPSAARSDQSERAMLKNLGSWIGLWTLARDIPLRHIDLAPKECLIRAYESGNLLSVVPFISRMIQQGIKSKWLKPPNPWVMSILRVMVEIYRLPHLTVNLKFEIEIMCNAFAVKIEDIVPVDNLKNVKVYTGPGAITDFDCLPEEPQEKAPKFHVQYVHINPSIALFRQQPHLKKAVYMSINRAIQEIIAPVVDRLVMIASITARELVLKDFAMEPDENKMLKASCSMVQSLAGNLASVTCKDPLRTSIMNNLRATLGGAHGKPVAAHIDHAIHTIVADNLDLACAVVQKAAAEAAVRTTEEQLADATTTRKTHRERSGRRLPFYDINFVGSPGYAFAQTLPDSLKPKLGGVSAQQLQVYDDFLAPSISGVSPPGGDASLTDLSKAMKDGPDGDSHYEGHDGLDTDPRGNWGADVQGESMDSYLKSVEFQQNPGGGTNFESPRGPYMDPQINAFGGGYPEGGGGQDVPIGYNQGMEHSGIGLDMGVTPDPDATNYGNFPGSPTQGGNSEQLDFMSSTKKIDIFVAELMNALVGLQQIRTLSDLNPNHPVVRMFSRVSAIVLSSQNKYEVSVYAAQIVFPKLFKRALLHREACLTVIDVLVNVVPSIRAKIAELVIGSIPQQKFHREVVPALLHYNLLAIHDYDTHLSSLIVSRDSQALDFANYLLQNMVKTTALVPRDLINTLEALMAANPSDFELGSLVDSVRASTQHIQTPVPESHFSGTQRRKARTDYDFSRKPIIEALRPKIGGLLNEWTELCGNGNEKVFPQFVQQLQQRGFYSPKETPSEIELSFYHLLLEAALALTKPLPNEDPLDSKPDSPPKLNYRSIDAVAKLFILLVKYSYDKVAILTRILVEIGRLVHNGQDSQIDQRPYYRFFASMLMEFNIPDPLFEPHSFVLLLEFRDIFHAFQPSAYPGFTFSWLKLVSHRMFMPKLLKAADQEGWVPMQELIVDLFQFLEPWLREAQLIPPIKLLYQGTLRTLLVLLHDFPEFLCNFHFSFCDVIPPTCIQLRNLILSAFPHTMKLPDPFIPNLKVDLLPEIKEPPNIQSNYWEALVVVGLKVHLDSFLRSCKPIAFLVDLSNAIRQGAHGGLGYNVQVINALVLYVGARALSEPNECSPQAPMEIFRYLAAHCDTEGRYLLFNAIANQLRFPNNHTHYFSCVLLFLFAEAQHEIVQEQITRVLVERLIVHRPHPWGLLITFIELIKNPRYNFWSRGFTRCAPEIERLFYQVGTHIAQHKSE